MNTSNKKNLILTLALSLSYMTSYCIDPNVQQANAAAQRRATRAYDRIERQIRNQWVDHLPERDIRVLITAEQNNFALQEARRLRLPVIPRALINNALQSNQAVVNVVNNVLGTNSQSASEESKTT